jgi:uncharacterized tellurite resistance protein B-like protein
MNFSFSFLNWSSIKDRKVMDKSSSLKQLMKILIGVAWIDGKIQPEERQYLQRLAQAQGLADDSDLKPWLYELRAVSMAECYTWIEEYLGTNPTVEASHQLLEAVSGLIYSDGDVASEEAKLVSRLLQLEAVPSEPKQFSQAVLQGVQKLYRRWLENVQGVL